ncbi:MAG TPA: EI24 domain-containing protein, partial [Caldimonas sp.]|nr:EI24 domain-containing protein [Caldimonas sp.]
MAVADVFDAAQPPAMTPRLIDAFWRAVAYCLHPKVVALSLAPLAIVGGSAALLGYLGWEPAVGAVRAWLEDWSLLAAFFGWLDAIGAAGLHSVVAPLVVVALAVPIFVVASLVVVAWLMTPAIVRLVATRRFPDLERRRGAGFWQSIGWSLV